MATYRDQLTEQFDALTGGVVGCALDRLGRVATGDELQLAIAYFWNHRKELELLSLSDRQQAIQDLFL